jgi:hypothetical protein
VNVEYPTSFDAEIRERLEAMEKTVEDHGVRLDRMVQGINAIGENVQWLVQNTQGIFQMFQSPQFMSQMTNALMGGVGSAGRPEESEPGPAEGTNG